MVAKLDAQHEGQTARGGMACARGAYSRLPRAVTEAEMIRFLKPDQQADRFFRSVDEEAVAEAQRFDGKPALITNASDLAPAEAVARHQARANIARLRRHARTDGAWRPNPRPGIRHRDRAGPPPPARPYPRPRHDLLHGWRPQPCQAHAPEGKRPRRQLAISSRATSAITQGPVNAPPAACRPHPPTTGATAGCPQPELTGGCTSAHLVGSVFLATRWRGELWAGRSRWICARAGAS